jgi:hypothetical protein
MSTFQIFAKFMSSPGFGVNPDVNGFFTDGQIRVVNPNSSGNSFRTPTQSEFINYISQSFRVFKWSFISLIPFPFSGSSVSQYWLIYPAIPGVPFKLPTQTGVTSAQTAGNLPKGNPQF